jgi:hypothetical protein
MESRKKIKSYLDFVDADIQEVRKKVAEHKAQSEFHKQQHEYWTRQAEALSTIYFRISMDSAR